ncbi:Ada metal-binding domain-containing protein [Mucilaginibacter sp. BT774]|uniref:Ada metal-binding domain-containing protein n=1 Tax=Mucilaginibacter sp. BT774 TaxID=3062276 RepID=UPI002676EC76|nr:Ada metal-binding domain-containing protein [Mucilaginibacter sp. BT774]MDO3624917.1 Ada metal-binding domain-containing protein [Mucilaginibacter sp. BT774]
MIAHLELGDTAFKRSRKLKGLIDCGQVQLAGNKKLKIYGTLKCSSGKRMKTENRIFFESAREAANRGYRPCGHCMRGQYLLWRQLRIQ